MPELPESSRLEAALFLAKEPLPSRRLAQLADIDTSRIRPLLRDLNRRYLVDNSAFGVVEVAGGFQLRTRPEFAAWLFRLQEIPVEVRLSPAAMETLSIIAYQQPILRAKIEEIRGVQSGEILRQLLEMDLIRITGRLDEPGRPFLYGTTKRFLQVYGLTSIDDLPKGEFSEEPENPSEAEPEAKPEKGSED